MKNVLKLLTLFIMSSLAYVFLNNQAEALEKNPTKGEMIAISNANE